MKRVSAFSEVYVFDKTALAGPVPRMYNAANVTPLGNDLQLDFIGRPLLRRIEARLVPGRRS
jgi:hypothetical protein